MSRRINLRILLLGTLPPLFLMVLAYALDLIWKAFHGSGLFVVILALGAATVLGVVAKEFYLPWLRRDRQGVLGRVMASLAVLLVAVVALMGYRDVALALALIGVVVGVKWWKDRGPVLRDDESSWYYAGEAPKEGGKGDPEALPLAPADPHEVLGIQAGATDEEVKAAYRRIIKECHPDANGGVGDTTRFRRAVEAYRALMGE